MSKAPVLLLAALALAGCAAPGLGRVRDDLARQLPEAHIGRGRAYGFGPLTLGLARWVVGRAEPDDEDALVARDLLGHVRRVRFASYPVRGAFDARHAATPRVLRRLTEQEGWLLLAAARDDSEAVWVLYKLRGDRPTDLLTVTLDREELTLAHVTGRLDRVVERVLAERLAEALDGVVQVEPEVAGANE